MPDDTNAIILRQIMAAVTESARDGRVSASECYASLCRLAERNNCKMTKDEEVLISAFRSAIKPGGFLDLAGGDSPVALATTALLMSMITIRLTRTLEAASN